jgi:amidase
VRAAIGSWRTAGAEVTSVSVPLHRHGLEIWDVIATDGATSQMIDGNGYGLSWAGLHDPELVGTTPEAAERGHELADTVKLAMLTGRYALGAGDGRHYAMARNLALDLTAAYDDALRRADVLVMPTLPLVAKPIPPAGASREEYLAGSGGMIANTAPIDVTGHPAITVPAGMANVAGGPGGGLPAGLMIIGPHFGDAACLRVAQAFETAAGFPAPPPPGARRARARVIREVRRGHLLRHAHLPGVQHQLGVSAWSIALSLTCSGSACPTCPAG